MFIMIIMYLELHFHKKRVFFVKTIDALNLWNIFQIYNTSLSIITQFLILKFHVIVFWKFENHAQIIHIFNYFSMLWKFHIPLEKYNTVIINKSLYDISYMVLAFYMHNKFTITIKSIFHYFLSSQNILTTQHKKYILCLTEE